MFALYDADKESLTSLLIRLSFYEEKYNANSL